MVYHTNVWYYWMNHIGSVCSCLNGWNNNVFVVVRCRQNLNTYSWYVKAFPIFLLFQPAVMNRKNKLQAWIIASITFYLFACLSVSVSLLLCHILDAAEASSCQSMSRHPSHLCPSVPSSSSSSLDLQHGSSSSPCNFVCCQVQFLLVLAILLAFLHVLRVVQSYSPSNLQYGPQSAFIGLIQSVQEKLCFFTLQCKCTVTPIGW